MWWACRGDVLTLMMSEWRSMAPKARVPTTTFKLLTAFMTR
jgi:hypothetical protein